MSNLQQVTITEDNDWEGEVFSYIMDLTLEQIDTINNTLMSQDGEAENESSFNVVVGTNYTKEMVDMINKHSNNSYMDRIGFYRFKDDADLNNPDTFYKGAMLIKIK